MERQKNSHLTLFDLSSPLGYMSTDSSSSSPATSQGSSATPVSDHQTDVSNDKVTSVPSSDDLVTADKERAVMEASFKSNPRAFPARSEAIKEANSSNSELKFIIEKYEDIQGHAPAPPPPAVEGRATATKPPSLEEYNTLLENNGILQRNVLTLKAVAAQLAEELKVASALHSTDQHCREVVEYTNALNSMDGQLNQVEEYRQQIRGLQHLIQRKDKTITFLQEEIDRIQKESEKRCYTMLMEKNKTIEQLVAKIDYLQSLE